MNKLSINELKDILNRYEIDFEETESGIFATRRNVPFGYSDMKIPLFCGRDKYWAMSSLVAWVLQKEAEIENNL